MLRLKGSKNLLGGGGIEEVGGGGNCENENKGPDGGGGSAEGEGGVQRLLLSFGSCLFLCLTSLFLSVMSVSGSPGAFFTISLATSFLRTSGSFSKEPTTGFPAPNVDMSSKTSSKGFCFLSIVLLIRSSFCLKLVLLIQSPVT